MIVSDIVTRVQRQFGDEASVQIDSNDIMRWINDGANKLAQEQDILQATGVMSSVAGTNSYALPSDLLAVRTMYYNNKKLKFLKRTEYDEYINSTDPDEIQVGTSFLYTQWGPNYVLYPKPDTSIANGIKLFYIQRPTKVTTTADQCPLPEEYHPRLVEYCLQQAYQTDEDWDAATQMSNQLEDGVQKLTQSVNFKDRETYPVITVLADDL
jgi:hypothetical protein